jgi:hypothetical protein
MRLAFEAEYSYPYSSKINNWQSQGCANPWSQVVTQTRLCAVAPNICESWVRNLLHITLLATRIFKWFQDFGQFGHSWRRAILPCSICLYNMVFIYGQGKLSYLPRKRARSASRREHLDKSEAFPGQIFSRFMQHRVHNVSVVYCLTNTLSAEQGARKKGVVYLSSFITTGLGKRSSQSLRARGSTQQNNDRLMENNPEVSWVVT